MSAAHFALDVYTRPIGGAWDVSIRDHTTQAEALSDLRRRILHHHELGRLVIRHGASAIAYDCGERRVILRVRCVDERKPMSWHPMRAAHVIERVEIVSR